MASAAEVPNAAAFLASALPWPVAGGPQFFINVHYRRPVLKDGKPVLDKKGVAQMMYPGRACKTVQEAASVVAWANSFENYTGTDVYVCMSGQSIAKEKLNSRGSKYYTAVRDRSNALIHKSLYVDVDVKPADLSKGYPDTLTAATEFGNIRRAIGLPVPTMVVRSGSGGFHAHWCFADPIDTATFDTLSHALVGALQKHGFRGDTGCTIDRVRLLRVPDTFNHKHGGKAPVTVGFSSGNFYSLEAIAKPLEPYKGYVPPQVTASRATVLGAPSPKLAQLAAMNDPSSLASGIVTSTGPVPIADLAKVCPWVAHTLMTGGAGNNNPLWLQSTNVALFTVEQRDAAHWMAQGHADYTPAGTDDLWYRQLNTKQDRNLGWPRCSSIHAQGATQCQTCPHLQKNKSPFNFILTAPAQVTAPQNTDSALSGTSTTGLKSAGVTAPLPAGYSYGPQGNILVTMEDEEGKQYQEPIGWLYPMSSPWMQDHPASFNFTTFTGGTVGIDAYERQIRLPLELVHDKSQLAKTLAQQHVVISPNLIPRFATFMTSWIETLRTDRDMVVQSAPYGWHRNGTKIAGFIYAKQVHSKGMPRPAANPDPVLERQYTPTGDLTPWIAAAKMVTDQQRPQLDAMLASAFAAPLVALVGQTGLLMSTYSAESGIGKSTTMKIAQAVWGHPKKAVQSLSDTINSVVKKIGDLKNLPMYWDELKTELDTHRFVQLAFQLAQGKEKSRMAADTSYREPGTWETMLCSTSNDSLMSHITAATKTTSAGIARIFEFVVPPGVKGQISPASAQQLTADLDNNYGQAGLVYAKFLGANYERVSKEVDNKLHEFERRYHVVSEERFWLAMITVVVMGAKYANELKLTQINETNLETFIIDTFQTMRKERAEAPVDLSNPTSMLGHVSRYLNIKRPRNTIVTNLMHNGQGRPPAPGTPGAIQIRHDVNNRIDEVQVHFAIDTMTCRFLKAPFMDWLDDQELSRKLVTEKLKNIFNMREHRTRLGAGTHYVTNAEQCLEFNYGDPVFNGYIEV